MKRNVTIAVSVFAAILAVLLVGYALLNSNGEVAARTVASQFVEELQNVPLTAGEGALKAAIEERYTPFVTEELLAEWQADPASAPGREASSPWPDRIFIKSVTEQGDSYVINADVLYVTSVEEATPEEDAAGVMVVTILVRPTDDGWRIAAYEELFGEGLEDTADET